MLLMLGGLPKRALQTLIWDRANAATPSAPLRLDLATATECSRAAVTKWEAAKNAPRDEDGLAVVVFIGNYDSFFLSKLTDDPGLTILHGLKPMCLAKLMNSITSTRRSPLSSRFTHDSATLSRCASSSA